MMTILFQSEHSAFNDYSVGGGVHPWLLTYIAGNNAERLQ